MDNSDYLKKRVHDQAEISKRIVKKDFISNRGYIVNVNVNDY